MQIVFVQTCSSEWSLKRIIRFSLLSTTGTPITESGHPTRVREEGGKARKTISSKSRESKTETEETLYCFLFHTSFLLPKFPPWAEQTGREKQERQRKKKGWRGGRAESVNANLWVWLTLCVQHALSCCCDCGWLLQPASSAFRKRNVYAKNESLNQFTMWMWDSNFQAFAGRIPRKKEQQPESLVGPAGWPPACWHRWHFHLETDFMQGSSLHTSTSAFFSLFFLWILLCFIIIFLKIAFWDTSRNFF